MGLRVEGADPQWGLRTDYEFSNCTGEGPGVERYLKNNTCIPTGSSSSNLYRFLDTGVEIVGCSGCAGPFTGLINTCNVLHSNLAMEQTKCAPAASTVSSGVLTSTAGGTGSSSSAATVVPSWLSSFVSVLCVAAAVVGLIVCPRSQREARSAKR